MARWAASEVRWERAIASLYSLAFRFGGAFLLTGRASTALRPGVLLLSTGLVLGNRPLPDQRGWIESQAVQMWSAVISGDAGRVWPLLTVLLGVLIVGRTTIDRIRARDEAAKDANRHLAELGARLRELCDELAVWRRELAGSRSARLDSWVESVSGRRFGWRPDGGLNEQDDRHVGWRRLHLSEGADDPIQDALDRVMAVEGRIREAGLEHVAMRLTDPVAPSIRELGLFNSWRGASRLSMPHVPRPTDLRQRLDAVRERMFLWGSLDPDHEIPSLRVPVGEPALGPHAEVLPLGMPASESALGTSSLAVARNKELAARTRRAETELETHAFECAEILDRQVAEAMVLELHLRRVVWFLRRRTAGSAFVRALSVIQR